MKRYDEYIIIFIILYCEIIQITQELYQANQINVAINLCTLLYFSTICKDLQQNWYSDKFAGKFYFGRIFIWYCKVVCSSVLSRQSRVSKHKEEILYDLTTLYRLCLLVNKRQIYFTNKNRQVFILGFHNEIFSFFFIL